MPQRNEVLAGIVAPVMFGAVILVLTVAQYDFVAGLGRRSR